MAKVDENELYDAMDEKEILWAIHKNLIGLDRQVKTIRQVCAWFFILSLLSVVAAIIIWVGAANDSSTPTTNTNCPAGEVIC
jgi:hypothetical protein